MLLDIDEDSQPAFFIENERQRYSLEEDADNKTELKLYALTLSMRKLISNI